MKIFDWHKWPFELCRTAKEIDRFLVKHEISKKKIAQVCSVGMAVNMQEWRYEQLIDQTLMKAGVSREVILERKYPYMDTVLLPCQATICEPLFFVFDDGSTFEMMPDYTDGLRLGVNHLNPEVQTGVNEQNYYPDLLFSRLIGASINEISILNRRIVKQGGKYDYTEESSDITFQFSLSGEYGFSISRSCEGWFDVAVLDQRRFVALGYAVSDIRFGEYMKAVKRIRQINIVEGHDTSSYFWIMPVRIIPAKDPECRDDVDEYRIEEISIEEDDVNGFLYYFLQKYFDHTVSYDGLRDDYTGRGFEWNLEYNLYSRDTMRKMLKDIAHCAELLVSDFESEELAGLKSYFNYWDFASREERNRPGQPDESIKTEIIKNNIDIAVSFYERFSARMEAMLDHCPEEYGWISFMGP